MKVLSALWLQYLSEHVSISRTQGTNKKLRTYGTSEISQICSNCLEKYAEPQDKEGINGQAEEPSVNHSTRYRRGPLVGLLLDPLLGADRFPIPSLVCSSVRSSVCRGSRRGPRITKLCNF